MYSCRCSLLGVFDIYINKKDFELKTPKNMQERHTNRMLYFKELAITCKHYFIPYIRRWHKIEAGMNILEIGCGEGGNLLPFAEMGCHTTGVDIAVCRIEEAKHYFDHCHAEGEFIAEDIFRLESLRRRYDIVICHDVIEHIDDKKALLLKISSYLKADGMAFISFPAWQMPFGGHQQICKSRVLSHLPFVHLLPARLYEALIKLFGESTQCADELLSIKQTRITIEQFEQVVSTTNLLVRHRLLWLVNPHYEVKFGLHPCRLPYVLSRIPYLRDFFSSSCFYLLTTK